MTPEQLRAWQQGRLDCRCRACGETYPARRQCLHCGSTDMEYREHVAGLRPGEKGDREAQWCQQVQHPRLPDPDHPQTGRQRAPRREQQRESDPRTHAALSVAPVTQEMGL